MKMKTTRKQTVKPVICLICILTMLLTGCGTPKVTLGKYESPMSATDENLKEQGRYLYELINGLFERADAGKINMDAVTFWGFSDGISWRREYSPQLYDSGLNPKYALYGTLQIKEYAGYDQ